MYQTKLHGFMDKKHFVMHFIYSRMLKRYTTDVIWNVAFGIDPDVQNNQENIFFQKCEEFFRIGLRDPFFRLGSNLN